MEEIIIYGAGNNGKTTYLALRKDKDKKVSFFVDKNSELVGKKYLGIEIISIEELKKHRNKKIIITPDNDQDDIEKKLREEGFVNLIKFDRKKFSIKTEARFLYNELNQKRCINLGEFFLQVFKEGEIRLKELPYVYGGSGVLDYAFICALAKKYSICGYAEIGSYIGTSLNLLSDYCKKLYSITAPTNSEYSMENFCKENNMPNYSERLSEMDKVDHIYCNSQEYSYKNISPDVDMYFIDADHSYEGVYRDTLNVFKDRKPDSIVVWHDFQQNGLYDEVVLAVKDALRDEFEKVYITDNNICAFFLPDTYKMDFPLTKREYVSQNKRRALYVYDTNVKVKTKE